MNTQTESTAKLEDINVIDGEIIEIKMPDAAQAVLNPAEYGRILMEPYAKQLTAARRKVSSSKYDIKTKEGMKTAKDLAKLFVTIRTTADEAKANAKRPIDAAGAAILAEYKPIETGAKAEEKKIKDIIAAEEKRLKDEEQAKIAKERARIEAIEERLVQIREIPNLLAQAASADISAKIDGLLAEQLDPALYEEFLEDAASAKIETVDKLRALLQSALVREEAARIAEKNAKELEQLRADVAKREQEAADQAAAVQRQKRDMDEIMEINALAGKAPTIETREQLGLALEQVLHFDPTFYGALESMATMARDMATKALQARLEQLPDLDPFIAPAPEPVKPAPAKCPPASEVLDVLANHYQVDKETVNVWMIDLRDDFMKLEV
jgi:hypothetical protein